MVAPCNARGQNDDKKEVRRNWINQENRKVLKLYSLKTMLNLNKKKKKKNPEFNFRMQIQIWDEYMNDLVEQYMVVFESRSLSVKENIVNFKRI